LQTTKQRGERCTEERGFTRIECSGVLCFILLPNRFVSRCDFNEVPVSVSDDGDFEATISAFVECPAAHFPGHYEVNLSCAAAQGAQRGGDYGKQGRDGIFCNTLLNRQM
jgi:hypothetical protein